jgi:hypothetical protein
MTTILQSVKTSDYTLTALDEEVVFDVTAASRIATIPSGLTDATMFTIQRKGSGANTVTLQRSGSETIAGGTTLVLSDTLTSVTIIKQGTNWIVTGGWPQGVGLTTAPATAAQNTIQATADVPVVTLKSRTATPPANLALEEWQTSAGAVFGGFSDIGKSDFDGVATATIRARAFLKSRATASDVALYLERADGGSSALDLYNAKADVDLGPSNVGKSKLLRVYSASSDRPQGDPMMYIESTGAIYNHRWVVISGTTENTGGTDAFRILHPTSDSFMLGIWSDLGGSMPAVQIKQSSDPLSYLISGIDLSGNHTFSLEANGDLKWSGSTYAASDCRLSRLQANIMKFYATSLHFDNNRAIQFFKADGTTVVNGFQLTSGNEFQFGQANAGINMRSYGRWHVRVNSDAGYIMDLAETGSQGVVGIGIAASGSHMLLVGNSGTTTRTGVVSRGMAAQTGDLFRAESSAPATLWAVGSAGHNTFGEAVNIIVGTTTGTKFGTATTQKMGWWNTTPIVQPTTAVAAATFVANTSLISNDTATFDGYTIGQVVKALRNMGLLA